MPSLRTEITEIGTGMGMLGMGDLEECLRARPSALLNVLPEHWEALAEAWSSGRYRSEFLGAFANGRAFLKARDGLRWRMPVRIEWKGPQRQPAYDFLPADLRIDHVYLVSCKYLSRILVNAAPAHVFDRGLSNRGEGYRGDDWYEQVAPESYNALYQAVRAQLSGVATLPAKSSELTVDQRGVIKRHFKRSWPESLTAIYRSFSFAVAKASCHRLEAALPRLADREVFLWRLLRLNAAPYYVLGTSPAGPLRLRIATPWDWRQEFELESFECWPEAVGQPQVAWRAQTRQRGTGRAREVAGHVEIRWSHGKFGGSPEAKVYLDTPYEDVPGYFPVD
jgi:hypothetical protein